MIAERRERTVLETISHLPASGFVLIGGYAVNAYVPPRFSGDCDLVVLSGMTAIEELLLRNQFVRKEEGEAPYGVGTYLRYWKEEEKAGFDLLQGSVLDNRTGILFESALFEKYSAERVTNGKMDVRIIKLRVVDPELLFAMKFVPVRRADVRDMFMLSGKDLNWDLVIEHIANKCGRVIIEASLDRIKSIVEATGYRDDINSTFGRIPNNRYDLCQRRLNEFLSRLKNGLTRSS
jgi:hypothetical protein